jgi:hypothetical protein
VPLSRFCSFGQNLQTRSARRTPLCTADKHVSYGRVPCDWRGSWQTHGCFPHSLHVAALQEMRIYIVFVRKEASPLATRGSGLVHLSTLSGQGCPDVRKKNRKYEKWDGTDLSLCNFPVTGHRLNICKASAYVTLYCFIHLTFLWNTIKIVWHIRFSLVTWSMHHIAFPW